METSENQKQTIDTKVKDWRKAEPNDVVFELTKPDGTIYGMTKEDFDRVVDVFALLSKWDRDLKQDQK